MENNRTPAKPALEISLALSGGAARGTFHLGFIQALQENGVQIKAISGTSAGSLVGGALACGLSPEEIMRIVKSQEFKKLFTFNWFRKSLFSIDYNSDVIHRLFPLADIKETKIPFYACVTDINNHEVIYADEGKGQTLILASCALIPLFEPLMYENRLLADGGFLDILPTTPLLKHEYPILGINLIPKKIPRKYNFFTLTGRVFQILFSTRLSQDIKRCAWYVSPKTLNSVKMFSLKNLQTGFDLGYAEGLQWCETQL